MTSVGVLAGAAPSSALLSELHTAMGMVSSAWPSLKLAVLSLPHAIDRSGFCNLSGWLPQLLDEAHCVAGEISTVGRLAFGAWFASSGYMAGWLLLWVDLF